MKISCNCNVWWTLEWLMRLRLILRYIIAWRIGQERTDTNSDKYCLNFIVNWAPIHLVFPNWKNGLCFVVLCCSLVPVINGHIVQYHFTRTGTIIRVAIKQIWRNRYMNFINPRVAHTKTIATKGTPNLCGYTLFPDQQTLLLPW